MTAPALPVGTWSQVAVTLEGATGTLYLNSAVVASVAVMTRADQLLAPNTATGGQQNYLARSAGTSLPKFRGALDDVQFIRATLSAADVAALLPPTTLSATGTLYVDVRATDSTAGTVTWKSSGTAGNFTRVGTPAPTANVAGTGIPSIRARHKPRRSLYDRPELQHTPTTAETKALTASSATAGLSIAQTPLRYLPYRTQRWLMAQNIPSKNRRYSPLANR